MLLRWLVHPMSCWQIFTRKMLYNNQNITNRYVGWVEFLHISCNMTNHYQQICWMSCWRLGFLRCFFSLLERQWKMKPSLWLLKRIMFSAKGPLFLMKASMDFSKWVLSLHCIAFLYLHQLTEFRNLFGQRPQRADVLWK